MRVDKSSTADFSFSNLRRSRAASMPLALLLPLLLAIPPAQ